MNQWKVFGFVLGTLLTLTATPTRGAGRFPESMSVLQRARLLGLEFSIQDAFDSARPNAVRPLALELLRMAEAANDTVDMLAAMNSLGRMYVALGVVDSAQAACASAARLARQARDTTALFTAVNNSAAAYELAGDNRTALAVFRDAQALADAGGDLDDRAVASHNLGAIFQRLVMPDSALTYYCRAIALRRGTPFSSSTYHSYAGAGHVLQYQLHRYYEAHAYYDTAAFHLRQFRRRLANHLDRAALSSATSGLYEEWTSSWMSAAESSEIPHEVAVLAALAIAERSRAQALRDSKEELASDLDTAVTRGPTLGANLAAEGAGLMHALRARKVACAYYILHGDSLRIICFGSTGRAYMIEQKCPNFGLSESLPGLLHAIGDPSLEAMPVYVRNNPYALDTLLHRASPLLLPDSLAAMIDRDKALLVIADGWVSLVPFAALVRKGGKRLCQTASVRYSPSLYAELDVFARRPWSGLRDSTRPMKALVIGNPEGAGDPIPRARDEADSIAAMFGVESVTGSRATIDLVRRNWGTADVIHLATHASAFLGFDEAKNSWVALANGAHLTLEEIVTRLPNSKARLVVLSACQTALGGPLPSEGLIGLQWAVIDRGAQSCVATLWSVYDETTGPIIVSFYRHLLHDGERPAEALARAQTEFLTKHPKWADPTCWAAFRIMGGD